MEKIDVENLWLKYSALFKRAFGNKKNVTNFLDKFGEKIILCPAAHKIDQKYCLPGGLMMQSIDVALTMKKIAEAINLEIKPESILRVALAHDLGKIGTEDFSYFLEQDSDWHREKLGAHYKFNESMPRMPVTHTSLYILSSNGISLTLEETRAITTSYGLGKEENRSYGYMNSNLQSLLQSARLLTVQTRQ
jgi:hypothetical protein